MQSGRSVTDIDGAMARVIVLIGCLYHAFGQFLLYGHKGNGYYAMSIEYHRNNANRDINKKKTTRIVM